MSNMDVGAADAQTRLQEETAMIRQFGAATMLAMTTFLIASIGEAQESASARAPVQASKKFDVRIPDITEVYTEEQIRAFLASTFEEHTEEVEVRGRREPVTRNVWPGIAAPIWAMLNPAQSWRIFAPLPPDRSGALAFSADVTTPYQQPTARTAIDW